MAINLVNVLVTNGLTLELLNIINQVQSVSMTYIRSQDHAMKRHTYINLTIADFTRKLCYLFVQIQNRTTRGSSKCLARLNSL